MNKNVLLLGPTGIVLDDIRSAVAIPDVTLFGETTLDDVRTMFGEQSIDVVIIGADIDIDMRMQIVRHIINTSTSTTIHMQDADSGREGMMPFINAILRGLQGEKATLLSRKYGPALGVGLLWILLLFLSVARVDRLSAQITLMAALAYLGGVATNWVKPVCVNAVEFKA